MQLNSAVEKNSFVKYLQIWFWQCSPWHFKVFKLLLNSWNNSLSCRSIHFIKEFSLKWIFNDGIAAEFSWLRGILSNKNKTAKNIDIDIMNNVVKIIIWSKAPILAEKLLITHSKFCSIRIKNDIAENTFTIKHEIPLKSLFSIISPTSSITNTNFFCLYWIWKMI